MEFKSTSEPSYTMMTATLDHGEGIVIEGGSMISYSGEIETETITGSSDEEGGLIDAVKKSILSDEKLFKNRFTAVENGVEISFAQHTPGDMKGIRLNNDKWMINSGCYVANSPAIDTELESGGKDSLLGGGGLFFLSAQGNGALFIGSYGGIVGHELAEGEKLTVDSEHLVAWQSRLDFTSKSFGGIKSTILGGEGFVAEFTGPGFVYIQTRDLGSFVNEIHAKMPTTD